MSPTLLLDLDGTLVDSVPDIAAALNRTLAARGLAPFTDRETAGMVGDGSDRLLAAMSGTESINVPSRSRRSVGDTVLHSET
jgi:phosphoglycolate phosphatase-like HAD superfamily hydrolase